MQIHFHVNHESLNSKNTQYKSQKRSYLVTHLALIIITFSSEFSKDLYSQGTGTSWECRSCISIPSTASEPGVCDHSEIAHTLELQEYSGLFFLPHLLFTTPVLWNSCPISCNHLRTLLTFLIHISECSRQLLAGLFWKPVTAQL